MTLGGACDELHRKDPSFNFSDGPVRQNSSTPLNTAP